MTETVRGRKTPKEGLKSGLSPDGASGEDEISEIHREADGSSKV